MPPCQYDEGGGGEVLEFEENLAVMAIDGSRWGSVTRAHGIRSALRQSGAIRVPSHCPHLVVSELRVEGCDSHRAT